MLVMSALLNVVLVVVLLQLRTVPQPAACKCGFEILGQEFKILACARKRLCDYCVALVVVPLQPANENLGFEFQGLESAGPTRARDRLRNNCSRE